MYPRTQTLIDKLSEIHPKGFDLSLGRITSLLAKLGNPHQQIPPALHVAGTNGKGSTLAFMRAILEAADYRVHVHTSPHLVNWGERYRLAGKLVDDETLASAIARCADANAGQPITIFEIMSAVMFILFSEHDADFSLVEVGLGGRFDATNVIEAPVACAISTVALDHQAYLGDTLAKIAFEKAGIIKPGAPVAVGIQHDEARQVIEEVAVSKNAPVSFANQDFQGYEERGRFIYQDEDGLLDLPMPRLVGEHQLANASLAIKTLRMAAIPVSDDSIAQAMKTVSWPGRLERLPDGKVTAAIGADHILIDGGHNPNAGEAIAAELTRQVRGDAQKLLMICGMINTKEPLGFFQPFAPLQAQVLTVPVTMSDAGIDPVELAQIAARAGLETHALASLEEAFSSAREKCLQDKSMRVLICGSLYLVGEILNRNGTPPA